MKSVYSPSEHVIYNATFYDDYKRAGTWPADGVEVSDEDAATFNGSNEPTGKMLDYQNGALCWVDRPAPKLTKEQLIVQAEQNKSQLRTAADEEIAWRQDAVDAEIATEDETASLAEWKKYRVLLMRVDTSKAPDIVWPTPPGVVAS
ncbi:tail fiber assembly protein [Enterobacter roggenkampii]|uniref:tail fiber assembly protein n=1 Tax=Enterobacter roggenkampii TaxID=1812935 RepID=UPI0015E9B495|nr:tail fiber assembly protein [Enterobacter roggenkampii]QLU96050.1 tail fiber assembly protein [Enterobacter roggenkampii]